MADIILGIIHHAEINKKNKKDRADIINALAVDAQQRKAFWGTYTNQECIDRGSIAY